MQNSQKFINHPRLQWSLFFLLSQPAYLKSVTAETCTGPCDKSICHWAVALREMILLYPRAASKVPLECTESITQTLEPPKKAMLLLWWPHCVFGITLLGTIFDVFFFKITNFMNYSYYPEGNNNTLVNGTHIHNICPEPYPKQIVVHLHSHNFSPPLSF
jgi:hypothetical protein